MKLRNIYISMLDNDFALEVVFNSKSCSFKIIVFE